MAKKQWIENGVEIPASRVTKGEKFKERVCERLLSKAQRLSNALAEFKTEITTATDEVHEAILTENGGSLSDEWKGNFTYFSFDRSIKIEMSAQESIKFDDALIEVAQQHFANFLKNATANGGVDEMIRQLISDAFSKSKGDLDSKRVLALTKYRARIPSDKYPSFHLALDAIEKSINRTLSKKYHRVFVRNPKTDEYEIVNLNFSAL